MGFLSNEKRLNVSITRAKGLLIVIGNPQMLNQNCYWKDFIELCIKNKALVNYKNSAISETNFDEDVKTEEILEQNDNDTV